MPDQLDYQVNDLATSDMVRVYIVKKQVVISVVIH